MALPCQTCTALIRLLWRVNNSSCLWDIIVFFSPPKWDGLMSQICLKKRKKNPCKCCEKSPACRGTRPVIIGYRTTSYSQSRSWHIMRKSWQKTHKSVTTFLPHSVISSPSPLPLFFSLLRPEWSEFRSGHPAASEKTPLRRGKKGKSHRYRPV